MQKRTLGRNGPEIPVVTFGAWPIGGGMGHVPEETAIATVRRAVDLGVTAIDTAEYYRTSESVLGRALRGIPRDRVFIATKASSEPFNPDRVIEALENSLRALETDYVDLYQLHRFPNECPLEEALLGLRMAKESGKARYVGVSNFTTDQLDQARRLYPVQSLQPRLNIFDSEPVDSLLPYCHKENIGVIVHSPLAKGLLTGKFRPDHRFAEDDERSRFPRFSGDLFASYLRAAGTLEEIARAHDASLVTLAIAWTLHQPGVTSCIVGAKTPSQLDEHIRAVDISLGADELRQIDEIAGVARQFERSRGSV